jgi:hypothetical protein
MKKLTYVVELANDNLSREGYEYIIHLVNYYIKKYNWPKLILDEKVSTEDSW